jgi:hypothetical protein
MELSEFHALTSGRIPDWKYEHHVHHLGVLNVPSGRVEASDPLVNLGEGLVLSIPPGQYPVGVTLADVSPEQDGSHLRQTYLSLLLADGIIATVGHLTPVGKAPAPEGRLYGVPVDAGMVAFADADAARVAVTDDEWMDDLLGELDVFDEPDKPGASVALAKAALGENLISAPSGWGDGYYPVIGAFDANGRLLSIHIDLQVDEREDDPSGPVVVIPEYGSAMLRLCATTTAAAAIVRALALAASYLTGSLSPSTTSTVFTVLSALDLVALILLLAALVMARQTRVWFALILGWLGLAGAVVSTTAAAVAIIMDDEANRVPGWLEPSTSMTSAAIALGIVAVFALSSLLFARASRR